MLRVQHGGRGVEVDAHAGLEQRGVVGALGVEDHELVALLADEELDVDPSPGSGGDGVQQRLVGHEVRAGQRDAPLGRVDQRGEEAQVVLRGVARTARQHLSGDAVGVGGHRVRGDLVAEALVRLDVPVLGEDRPQGVDRRAVDASDELHPLPTSRVVLRLVVAGLDEVLRAHEGDPSVDDHQLAVVAQVRPLELTLQRTQRQHRVPVDAGGVQPDDELLVAGDAARCEVVEEQPDRHTTSRRGDEGVEERAGHLVPGSDVELHLDGGRGALDRLGHPLDRVAVARDQLDEVAVLEGQRPQVAVQRRHGVEVRPDRRPARRAAGRSRPGSLPRPRVGGPASWLPRWSAPGTGR